VRSENAPAIANSSTEFIMEINSTATILAALGVFLQAIAIAVAIILNRKRDKDRQ
jgi:hypothetical protein